MLRRIEHLTSTEIAALVVADADEDEVVVVPVLIVVVDDESDEVVEVDTESVEEKLMESVVVVDPELLLSFVIVTVHSFTSITWLLPFESVVGVSVIVHV